MYTEYCTKMLPHYSHSMIIYNEKKIKIDTKYIGLIKMHTRASVRQTRAVMSREQGPAV